MSDHKDMTHRHLRHKLQSLSRRLDELEEATNKLQKSEDELLDLQDKIIQAEGSNSSQLADVEALRKRLLRIQGKDEEVRKAEDLCRTVREKLEEEENLTKDLKAEIERLQRRMAELEKLEEAFGKSKSDCSQLCLSLNEEKNLTKKLSTELEALKARLKEVEGSEAKLNRAEQALAVEFEKLKGLTQSFLTERKRLLQKQQEDANVIFKLTEQLEHQKIRLGMPPDAGHADLMRSRIEDELSSTGILANKRAVRKKSCDYLKLSDDGLLNKTENQKNSSLEGSQEEDNKVKELTQEVERLKNRLKQLEIVEEDLKISERKNGELNEKYQVELNRAHNLAEQVEQLRTQLCGKAGGNGSCKTDMQGNSTAKVLENGKAENEEIIAKGFRQEKPKYKSSASVSEPTSPKLSPLHKREPKVRSRDLSHSEDPSPLSSRRALSPAHMARRKPKIPVVSSDNGLKESGRGPDEKARGVTYSPLNSSSSDAKKASVLSRYPPAANDQKPLRTVPKHADGDSKKSRLEKISKTYIGSDSESNNSDVVPESTCTVASLSALEKDPGSDQELLDQVEETVAVTVASTMSKANGSYAAYRSHIPLLSNDQGSESHSSASETESTGSRPSEPEPMLETTSAAVASRTAASRYSRYSNVRDSHSEGSSTRSSFDEELHSRTHLPDGVHLGPTQTLSGLEIQRVCSPREALRSKAVIKPVIVEIDRKEMMISEPVSTNGKPKISTKPVVTSTSKMTSSITFYPNDPSSSRTSSRSSSVSSEAMPTKERHTSTSNILIGPTSDHHGSVSVPYEISIPKSEIQLRSHPDQDSGMDYSGDSSSRPKLSTSRVESTASRRSYQRNNVSSLSPDCTADLNDAESGFESSSSGTTVTSWRSQRQNPHSLEDALPDARNVTVRSTWRNRGAASADDTRRGRGGTKAAMDGGSEDEVEPAPTWRAYPATTTDMEEVVNSRTGAGGSTAAAKGVKPLRAEMYMRQINNAEDTGLRRTKRSQSPSVDAGGLVRSIPHAPVTSQSWGRPSSQSPQGTDESPSSWRQQTSYERTTKPKGELWSSRSQGSGARTEGRSGAGSRPWTHRQAEHH
ncbi:leucine zipper protein 1 [Neosynchiropus ocellatus]